MNLLSQVTGFFNKPFPIKESWVSYMKQLLLISLFITFFLYVFKPFGLSTIEDNQFLVCFGFGCMTLLGALIYEGTIVQLLKLCGLLKRWTFGKWLLNNFGLVLFISLANFIFSRLVLFGDIQWELFPSMLYGTFMIGIIPFSLLGAFSLLQLEKKYQGIAQEINLKSKATEVGSLPGSVLIFDIPISKIRYIEALQNYVKVGYVNEENNLAFKTERSTLKHLLELGKEHGIVKSHRSFLVNKNTIISSSGNAQGLQLSLSNCETLIPVSRSYVPLFRSL